MGAGILGGVEIQLAREDTALVSSKITGKCPMSQVEAGVSWIFHPSCTAHGCLVLGAAWLLPAWGTHGRAALPFSWGHPDMLSARL